MKSRYGPQSNPLDCPIMMHANSNSVADPFPGAVPDDTILIAPRAGVDEIVLVKTTV